MPELDTAMDALNQAASELASPEPAATAELAQSVARSTATVQAQLDDLKAKMNEFLTATSKA